MMLGVGGFRLTLMPLSRFGALYSVDHVARRPSAYPVDGEVLWSLVPAKLSPVNCLCRG